MTMIITTIPMLATFWNQRVLVLAHGLLVVEQQDEKDQRRRQQRHRDDLNEKGDEHQRRARNQDNRSGQQQVEEVIGIEPRRLLDLVVQGVRPTEDFAEGP